jgi:hypothetical protein
MWWAIPAIIVIALVGAAVGLVAYKQRRLWPDARIRPDARPASEEQRHYGWAVDDGRARPRKGPMVAAAVIVLGLLAAAVALLVSSF